MKKKSPKSIPATRADVAKAVRIAKEEAADTAMAIMFTALIDKMGWDTKEIQELWEAVKSVDASIREKRVTVADLKTALKEESGILFK